MSEKTNHDFVLLDDLDSADRKRIIELVDRGISRREMLSLLGAIGISATSVGHLLSSAGQVAAATPKKGGTVIYAMDNHGPSDTLDPQLVTTNTDYSRSRCNFNGLTQFRDGLVPQPELAEEFSANAAVTEWTFKLHKDVRFHDGSKMTADDVIWSMNRHLGEESISKAKTLVSGVREWKKIDSHTVKAILDAPNADFPAILATFHFKILKKDTKDFQNPTGTGPYKLVEFAPGIRSRHIRNEDYWREGPNFDEVEIFAITDSVARTNALAAGDIDICVNLPPKSMTQIRDSDVADVLSVPSGSYMGMVCKLDSAPGNNPDFVMAMKLLADRENMVKRVLNNEGTVGNDNPINSAYGPDFCNDLPVRSYDPDKASYHLKKSGITTAEIHVAEVVSGVSDAVLLMQNAAKKIDLNLRIKKVPNDGYWGAVWRKEPMFVTTWNMRPTANVMLTLAFAPDAPWNDSKWSDARFGKILKEVRGVTDPMKRHEMYCDLQRMTRDGSGVIIPVHRNYIDGIVKGLHGIPNVSLGPCGGSEWPEFAWKA